MRARTAPRNYLLLPRLLSRIFTFLVVVVIVFVIVIILAITLEAVIVLKMRERLDLGREPEALEALDQFLRGALDAGGRGGFGGWGGVGKEREEGKGVGKKDWRTHLLHDRGARYN